MGTFDLQIRYRPIRIGFCVPDGDVQAFREAIRLTTTLWGGRFNTIIPVGWEPLSDSLVRSFRPDVLMAVRRNARVRSFIAGFPHIKAPPDLRELYSSHEKERYPHFLTAYHAIRHIYDEHIRGKVTPEVEPQLVELETTDPLADVVRCLVGEYPKQSEVGIDYPRLLKDQVGATLVRIPRDQELPADLWQRLLPIAITEHLLEEDYRSSEPRFGDSGVFVGSAGSFRDLVLYWNLLACGYTVAFFDPDHSSRCLPVCNALTSHIRSMKSAAPEWRREPALWQIDTSDDPPSELNGSFGRHHLAPKSYQRFSPTPMTWTFKEESVLASEGRFGKNSVTFPLSSKPWYDDVMPSSEHVAVSVSTNSVETNRILIPPHIPALNEFLSREFHPGFREVRTEPDGVAILCDIWKDNVTLLSIEAPKLLKEIFRLAGIAAQPSKPGLILARLVEQMGGLQGCRVLKIGGVRRLINKYGPLQSFLFGDARRIIEQGWESDYSDLYIEARDDKDLKSEAVFSFLLKREVFRPGLELRCDNCLLTDWHSLDEAKTRATCGLCGAEFNVAPQLRDQKWAYRRSGLFGREDNQEGGMPVALTLQQLDATLHRLAAWSGGHDLMWRSRRDRKCESDLVLLLTDNGSITGNNSPCVVLGECKADRGEISRKDVVNLKAVAKLLEKLGITVYLVFSKTGKFSQREIERCKLANDRYRSRAIMLSGRELEPYDPYERVNKQLSLKLSAIDLGDMTRATAQIFFRDGSK